MNSSPKGLTYLPNFITPDQELSLIKEIDSLPWDTSISRRRQQYGYPYDIKSKKLNPDSVPSIPKLIDKLVAVKLYDLKYMPKLADQAIVNEYQPGQGIAAHTDSPIFGPVVVSVSLLSLVVMEFEKDNKFFYNLVLEPRSALILTDEARNKWKHSIGKRYTEIIDDKIIERERRISITLRTVV